jgi:hypothetical protein
MNPTEFNPFEKIKERDGLLMRQLYELTPSENRVSYAHFRKLLEKDRTKHNIIKTKAATKSNAYFLTGNRSISARRMMLMILIAE